MSTGILNILRNSIRGNLRYAVGVAVDLSQRIHNKPTTTLTPESSVLQLKCFRIAIPVGKVTDGSHWWCDSRRRELRD